MFLSIFLFLFISSTLFKSSHTLSSQGELDPFPQAQLLNSKSGVNMFEELQSSNCDVAPYDSPFSGIEAFQDFDPLVASVYRYRQQQSVNLGSWFVLEQWMVPSLFKCAAGNRTSELDVASGWGSTSGAQALLEHHWDTFITQDDFDYLAGIGINTVRLPIGYWSLGPTFCEGTPFAAVASVYTNSWSKVVRAINMAGKAGIGVLVDLHGAVGSQNGQPHSGISDSVTGLFGNTSNEEKTLRVLTYLTKELATVPNVVGIQILNEPDNVATLADFYTNAISRMRAASLQGPNFPLYIHDGFDLDRFKSYVAGRTDFVVQDHHSYFVFTSTDASESASQHTQDIETIVSSQLASSPDDLRHNLIIGEWSCALTPESLSGEADPKESAQEFCMAQLAAYTRNTPGWSFWSYDKENCDSAWCFRSAVNQNLPSTFFSYGNSSLTPDQTQRILELEPDVSSLLESRGFLPLDRRRSDLSFYRHRARSIFQRRQINSNKGITNPDSDDPTSNQLLQMQGYSDGFATALKFASHNGSKLGFLGQYIAHRTEAAYRQGFVKGLRHGEDEITLLVNRS